ncbi:MAG: DUF1624 domain-containing protein [Chitinophagaceae bacterium]
MQTITAPAVTKPIFLEKTAGQRIQSIDLLRGLVMIIMALDHVRDYFHYDHFIGHDPLDFSTTTPILFLTRWITHFCAPVFVFLSGTSIFLYGSKRNSKKELSFFLLTRGLWLILVEILIITSVWDFRIINVFVALQVIWAIGISMVIMSVLIFLPFRVLLCLGLLIVFGHNLLDKITMSENDVPSFLWAAVHQFHIFNINDNMQVGLLYPFVPWLGVMILGFCLGKLFLPEVNSSYRKSFLRYAGAVAIILFMLLRLSKVYGDMHQWSQQKTSIFTILDFVNTTKYPPSLLYILMTIGPALIVLSFIEKSSNTVARKITVFGKVPFFYYILHLLLAHSLAWIAFFATGHTWNDLVFNFNSPDGSLPAGSGFPLSIVYAVWAVVIFILYFPCKWYANYKAAHKQWWLSYL